LIGGACQSQLRLAGFAGEFLDSLDHDLHFLVCVEHGAQHLVFGQLVRLGLHHQYGVSGAGHHHVQLTAREGGVAGIEQVALGFREADARRTDRPVEGHTGNSQGRGGADHRRDVRIHVFLRGHHRAHDLHFVHETIGEKRADRAVDQPRGQRFLLARPSLALEKAAGYLAYGVGLLLVVHGEREEILALAHALLGHDGHQHAGVLHGDQYGAGRLAGDTTRLQRDGTAAVLERFSYWVHVFSPILYGSTGAPGPGRRSV
jgi:hypothetical protein